MKISGWGRYLVVDAEMLFPTSQDEVGLFTKGKSLIARGLGRSYGDSANSSIVLQTKYLSHYISFDQNNGILSCEAGVSLYEILQLIVPKGWFLPVTPGTSYITIGGAIASDVHGKNHHIDGTFSQYIQSLMLLLGNGEVVNISKYEKPDLFYATCGGMGLTGVILSVTIQLKSIYSSQIQQTIIKTCSLEETISQFECNQASSYSVAWVDCLMKGRQLGRSLLMLGEHSTDGKFDVKVNNPINIPIDMPQQLLNHYSIKLFNALYYGKTIGKFSQQTLPFESFFYPLDKVNNWNRFYGAKGLVQYQFVIPKASGLPALKHIFAKIAGSGKGSFLAVLKVFGAENHNLLSFPIEGYTLALDFKVDALVFKLIRELDAIVLDYGGRIYLAKDALMSESTFKTSYLSWQKFEDIRMKYDAIGHFSSHQSIRLGLQ